MWNKPLRIFNQWINLFVTHKTLWYSYTLYRLSNSVWQSSTCSFPAFTFTPKNSTYITAHKVNSTAVFLVAMFNFVFILLILNKTLNILTDFMVYNILEIQRLKRHTYISVPDALDRLSSNISFLVPWLQRRLKLVPSCAFCYVVGKWTQIIVHLKQQKIFEK